MHWPTTLRWRIDGTTCRWCARRIVLFAGALLFLTSLHIGPASASETVYSNSKRFRIPFQFDSEELKRLGAREIQLFVSEDQGDNWRLSGSVDPDAGRFMYEAAREGEFWFSVRTIAGEGMIYPAGPHQPGLTVIVDTLPPTLELQLNESDPGRVQLAWSASDPHLDLETLQLEFRDPGQASWETVHLRVEAEGQTSWTVSESGIVEVRGTVADRAGNTIQASAKVRISMIPSAPQERPELSSPATANTPLIAQFADDGPDEFPIGATTTDTERFGSDANPIPREPVGERSRTPESDLSSVIRPAKATPPATQELPATSDPIHQTEHLVNSDTFRIGYQVENVGPSGVSKVDLYITEDGGNLWFHYGSDADKTSPYHVKVPRDGEYGFTFRITSGVGLVAVPPQPGERPDIVVIVDRAPPAVTLLPLRHGQDQNQVLIEWKASDRQLADRPVSLSYAMQSTGPWEMFESRLPNSGRFLWTVPTALGTRFYIRLEVRDAAGNVSRVETDQPFTIDHSRPRAQVTEVEAIKPAPH